VRRARERIAVFWAMLLMNLFAAALQRVELLARSGALGDDGTWVAAGLEIHAARAVDGWTLDRAVTLAWSNECCARSDKALCEYADRYYREELLSQRAKALGNAIRLYERGTWRHDRHRVEMPSFYVDTPRQYLFWALRENDSIRPQRDMPSSQSYLEKILRRWKGDRMDRLVQPLPEKGDRAFNASRRDGDQINESAKVRTFDQRRRSRNRG
jgi:hypothetical protein